MNTLELNIFTEESRNIVKEYICFICKGVFNDPVWNDACQHVFCRECIKNLEGDKGVVLCPQCKDEGNCNEINTHSMIKSVSVLITMIDKQKVYCKSKCSWMGTVKEYKEHKASCPKRKVLCRFKEAGCHLEIELDAKHAHESECDFRNINCSLCKGVFIHRNKSEHDRDCPHMNILCNHCECEIDISKLEQHLSSCQLVEIKCGYHLIGCIESFPRKEEQIHLDLFTEKHNELFLNYVVDMKNLVENKLKEYEIAVSELKEKVSLYEVQTELISPEENKKQTRLLNKKQKRPIDNGIQQESKESPSSTFELMKNGMYFLTSGLKLDYDTIINTSINNNHQFVLIDTKLNIKDSVEKWRIDVKLDNNRNWIAMGVIIKEILIKNDYKMKKGLKDCDHGFFGFSNEGILYHNNSSYKNNSKLNSISNLKTVLFEYENSTKVLKISLGNENFVKVDMVFPIQMNMTLLPCVILRNRNDQVKIHID